ncbi:MAG TPA: CinA family nicotinamide mononucleotide deamidase-related protein [bacterium]|nr:CinA family nicotinamide mononucleotide deamidase-related protein [bacterium]
MHIEVICTGDEVLTGKIVNSNFSYISQKLEDFGLGVKWGATVGDDRDDLLDAFQRAGQRADVVVVNGGLGPTVDDLSQEVAARAAGVKLELHEGWLEHMKAYFAGRGRTMPDNNTKQAMLPEGAEVLDNPIGTACGFAVTIGKARFYFTPGVPRELHRMLELEIIPRVLEKAGSQSVIRLKRFHSFGIGESHADALLTGLEAMVPDGTLKLGFRAHYPQLETKLTVRGATEEEIQTKLGPVVAEVRQRIGNFILAEDDETLEGVVLSLLGERGATVAIAETYTGGQAAARLAPLPGAEAVFTRGMVARRLGELYGALEMDGAAPPEDAPLAPEVAEAVAEAARRQAGADVGLAVLVALGDESQHPNIQSTICIGVSTGSEVASRRSRLVGNRDWIRLGAVEMGLDSLRRFLKGLPIKEKIDFERAAPN